jgi:hypothetical protein
MGVWEGIEYGIGRIDLGVKAIDRGVACEFCGCLDSPITCITVHTLQHCNSP